MPSIKLKPRLPPHGEPDSVERGVVVFKSANHSGAMVALRVPPAVARRIALPGGEPWEDLHLTLAYLGDAAAVSPDRLAALRSNIERLAAETAPLEGKVNGYGRFRSEDDEDVLWAHLDAPDLPALRHAVLEACAAADVPVAGDHGFTPHVTLAYVEPGEGEDSMPAAAPVRFRWLSLVVADSEFAIPLRGKHADEPIQSALPPRTFSALQSPSEGPYDELEDLERWAQDKGDLVVRADVDAVGCVVVKRGFSVSVAVEGVPAGARVLLDDLVVALGEVPHDLIASGRLAARLPGGDWIGPDRLGEVLTGELLATPVFLPDDLLALDGDLSTVSAADRLELLRSVLAPAGDHVVFPAQVPCSAEQELEVAVDAAAAWGVGLEVVSVTAVRADSGYAHGPADHLATMVLRPTPVRRAAWDESEHPRAEDGRFGSGAGAPGGSRAGQGDTQGSPERRPSPTVRPEHRAAVDAILAAGARFDGVQSAPRGELLLFTDPVTGSTLGLRAEAASPEAIVEKLRLKREEFGEIAIPSAFHATREETAARILAEGLKPGREWFDRPPSVYFSDSIGRAKGMARILSLKHSPPGAAFGLSPVGGVSRPSRGYAVVEFEAPDDAVEDEHDGELASSPQLPLAGSRRVERAVPPDKIRAVHFFDVDDKLVMTHPAPKKSAAASAFAVVRLVDEDVEKGWYVGIALLEDEVEKAWEESKHPRAEDGKFGAGGGGAVPSSEKPRDNPRDIKVDNMIGNRTASFRTEHVSLETIENHDGIIHISWLGSHGINAPGTTVTPHPGEVRALMRRLVSHADSVGIKRISAGPSNEDVYDALMRMGGREDDSIGAGNVVIDVDRIRRVAKDVWNNEDVEKDAMVTDGMAGVIAPEQGVFGSRRRSRYMDVPKSRTGMAVALELSADRRDVEKYITHSGSTWTVHAESGRVLGRHGSEAEAQAQLRAIEASKHRKTADGDGFPVVFGSHTFVTGTLRDWQFVDDPERPRASPYEALLLRSARVGSDYSELSEAPGLHHGGDCGTVYLSMDDLVEKAWEESEHPRAEDGRFGVGGGAAPKDSGVPESASDEKPMKPSDAAPYFERAKKLVGTFAFSQPPAPGSHGSAVSGATKAVSAEASATMKTDFVKGLAPGLNRSWAYGAGTPEQDMLRVAAHDLWGGEVIKSGHPGKAAERMEPEALAASTDKYFIEHSGGGTPRLPYNPAQAKDVRADFGEYLKLQYAVTQEHLRSSPDTITLYRGINTDDKKLMKKGAKVDLSLGAMSSATPDAKKAAQFGNVVLKIEVPKKYVLGNWRTGLGAEELDEHVVLGDNQTFKTSVERIGKATRMKAAETEEQDATTDETAVDEAPVTLSLIDDNGWDRRTVADLTQEEKAAWDESERPRAEDGRFGSVAGSGSADESRGQDLDARDRAVQKKLTDMSREGIAAVAELAKTLPGQAQDWDDLDAAQQDKVFQTWADEERSAAFGRRVTDMVAAARTAGVRELLSRAQAGDVEAEADVREIAAAQIRSYFGEGSVTEAQVAHVLENWDLNKDVDKYLDDGTIPLGDVDFSTLPLAVTDDNRAIRSRVFAALQANVSVDDELIAEQARAHADDEVNSAWDARSDEWKLKTGVSQGNATVAGGVDGKEYDWDSDDALGATRDDKYTVAARALVAARASQLNPDLSVDQIDDVSDDLWAGWKRDSQSPEGLAMQRAVEQLSGANSRMTDQQRFLAADYIKRDPAVKAVTRATYDVTQWVLSKAGVDDVDVYRGVKLSKADLDSAHPGLVDARLRGDEPEYTPLPKLKMKQAALQSFTMDRGVANSWRGVGNTPSDALRVVVRARVPREAVFSVPVFGDNFHEEREVVAIGAPWRAWDAWIDEAPSTASDYPLGGVRRKLMPGDIHFGQKGDK